MIVPTVLATTARRSWALCSVSESPDPVAATIAINVLPILRLSSVPSVAVGPARVARFA
jgi:hypothetical protein